MEYRPGDLNSSDRSPLLALLPPCSKCPDCDQQFRSLEDQHCLGTRYRASLTRKEAELTTASLVSNINRDISYLKTQCATRGNIIENRWKKKSRQKREQILLNADPHMYPEQWLIPHHLFKFEGDWPKIRERHTNYLLPYITIPVLRDDPSKFLSLLLNRIRFSPEQWAPHDSKRLSSAWHTAAFNVDYHFGSIIMRGPRYGEVTNWEKSLAESWEAVGYPRAILTLEAQESLGSLLRKIVEELLAGLENDSSIASNNWSELHNRGFKFSSSSEYWSEFLNQPFSPPPIFSIDKILSIAQTRMDNAGDELWLLQTDPAYMRRAISSIGRGHISAWGKSLHSFVAEELYLNIDTFSAWSRVRDETEYVKGVMSRFPDVVGFGEALPPDVDRALGALELLVANALHSQLSRMQPRLFEMMDCRGQLLVGPGTSSPMTMAEGDKILSPQLLEKDRLLWALMYLLQTNAEIPGVLDHSIVYSILDDHLRNCSPAERDRVSERLYNDISDAAALQEILWAIRFRRPLSTARHLDDCFANEDRKAWRWASKQDMRTGGNNEYQNPFQAFPKKMAEVASLVKAFEAVPFPTVGRPDQSWIESFENRHAALSAIWECYRDLHCKYFTRYQLPKEDIEDMLEILRADTKTEHVTALAAEKEKLLARISGPSRITRPAAPIQVEWRQPEADSTTAVVGTRTKKKTRPAKSELPGEKITKPLENLIITIDTPLLNKISIKQQTFTILTSMFSSGSEKEGKMVDWDVFVNAMNDVGFPAFQGPGSAVSFKADDSRCQWKGKIDFHKPHPVAKIHPVMMHAFGKRMNKWFGWSEETFEVIAKKS